MRLLRADTLEIEEFGFGEIPNYAILSHRWGKYELTLQDVEGRIWEQPGFQNSYRSIKYKAIEKVKQCCTKVKSDSFEYVWMDSCCIDKTSSAELSEAINSMYLWYYKAGRCYAYLADVESMATFKESEWFTRGWTLQELLAPAEVYFLNKDWKDLGTKKSLQEAISDQTRIPINILSGADLETATIAQRMSWASNRKTSRIEDRAYSLMGIFGINMPLLYGEGERAFIRLQEEIMKFSNDHSLFAWKSPDARGGLLATSPDAFSNSSNIIHFSHFGAHSGPVTVSSRGIHLELPIIGLGPGGLCMAILRCAERDKEDKPLAIYVKDTTLTMELFERVRSIGLECVDLRRFRRWHYPMTKICIRMGRMAPMGRVEASRNQDDAIKEAYDDFLRSNLMNFLDATQLFRAAQVGDLDDVWLLLTRSYVSANMEDDKGRTALWYAIIGSHEELVRILLARSDIDADFRDIQGRTPLSWVAEQGNEAIIKLLLEKSVDIEAVYQGKTPLCWAAENGHAAVIEPLLENGADTETTGILDRTPLLLAVENGHEAVVQLLLKNGADVEATVGINNTPLSLAAEKGHETILKLLLEKGADIEPTSGRTPLSSAVGSGHEAIVKLLLENGANPGGKDDPGWTPLFSAAEHGNVAIAKLLLESGAYIEAENQDKETPLFRAIKRGRHDFIKLLLEKGADIEAKDYTGSTPLLCAIQYCWYYPDIIWLLLEEGADIEAKDMIGNTPLSLATESRRPAIMQLLTEKSRQLRDHRLESF